MRPIYCFLLLALSLHADPVREFWFNGAEINRYELTQMRYGEAHPGHVEFIFVTEPFLTEKQVKNESGGSPSTDVLKLNALRTFNTGIYSYRTMTSTYQPIDLAKFPSALKTNTSVQDWCGQAFQQLNRTTNGWRGELRSYFEREGDQDFNLNEAQLEDAVWLKLRLAPESLSTGSIQIIPSGVHSRFAHKPVRIEQATAERTVDGALSHYVIRYETIERTLNITYETAFPHIIRSWKEVEAGDTTQAVLTHRIMNSNYWSEHRASDAPKRKTLGLEPLAQ
ncbi:septum formation inhibitor Maf [Coraliomargarita sp. W4R53]